MVKSKIKEVHTFEGLGRKKVESVSSGDICALIGIEGFEIGDTICDFEIRNHFHLLLSMNRP